MNDFNNKLALKITNAVSVMWCAYLFCLIALVSLPATLVAAGIVPRTFFPSFLIAPGLIILVAWIAQTFIQLVLLSVIMVGQKLQADATIEHVTKQHADLKDHIANILKEK